MSRVTVFRRPDATSIYVEWFDDDGRHKAALSRVLGHPVTDFELAKKIADRMSRAQEAKRNQQATELLGIPKKRTLSELFTRRHADLEARWTDKYKKSRERRRAFWLHNLGDVSLTSVNAALVERIARAEQGERSDRWRQDVLRYIVDSFSYAEKKLKWLEARHNLSAVDMPKVRSVSRAYTLDEAQKLLTALTDVHPVAGWMGAVAFQTGRRLSAIRQLAESDVTTDGEWAVVRFRGETDKARNTGEAVVYGLPERTDWSVSSQETCNEWMHEAETKAGVPHVHGRAWHGLKRLYATLTTGLDGADKQSGTRRETLEAHYRQDTLAPKKEVARRLSQIGKGQEATTP